MGRRLISLFALVVFGAFASAAASEARQVQSARPVAMSEAATSFLATLSAEERAAATRPFEDAAARVNWSNLPTAMAPRDGLSLAVMSPAQRQAAHTMLIATMSSQGYGKTAAIMWLDDILRAEETAWLASATLTPEQREQRERIISSRNSGNYFLIIFGEPGDSRWGWSISGHHMAANFTVVDGNVAFTPLFLGASPQTVRSGQYAGWRVLQHEIDRGFTLMASLNEEQRQDAVLADAVTADLFTGRGRKDSLAAPVGLRASQLDTQQQALLWGLIREFVGDVADEPAAVQLESIRRDGLDALHFAWWGRTDEPDQRFMYRIHGPSILIEYVRENDAATGGPSNHVHAIVRDPRNDYGEDWLGRHYTESPH